MGECALHLSFQWRKYAEYSIHARIFQKRQLWPILEPWKEISNLSYELSGVVSWPMYMSYFYMNESCKRFTRKCFIQQTKRVLISFLVRWNYYTRIHCWEGKFVWSSIWLQLHFIAFLNWIDMSISEITQIPSPLQVSDRTFSKELGRQQ